MNESRLRRTLAHGVGASACLLGATVALAQPGPGMPTGPGPGGEPDAPEGVAEAAPKSPGLLPTTAVLPPPKNPRKRWKLLEIDGYFRLRTEWLKNFSMGFDDDPSEGGAPWRRPLGCNTLGAPCDDNTQSANLRLRLEPTINLDEGTAIHTQIDVLDNLVLGSTPGDAPDQAALGPFGDTQDAPPSASDQVRVRRAWAEIALPLGTLELGRMPNHWGMGLMNNSGSEDPTAGTYDTDSEFGDTVDRASFSAAIPGTRLRARLASDWASTRLVSSQTDASRGGQAFDLDDQDDVNQYVLQISRLDTPAIFNDTAARGEFAVNWGLYLGYRTQTWANDLSDFEPGGPLDDAAFVPRGYKTYAPDVWLKLGYKDFRFELEATGEIGSIDRLDDLGQTRAQDVRRFGGVGRFSWTGLDGKLRLGLESGLATGDQWDGTPPGSLHLQDAAWLGGPTDSTLSRFAFDREYKVDLILFRELMGGVSNAIYGKPFFGYDLTKSISFSLANVTSFAMKPVSTPGNDSGLGVEFDSELSYRNGGFFAGLTYGVLFPMAGLDHPSDDALGFGEGNRGEAETAHAIQSRFVLSF